jgi:hypothetical protein
MEIAWPRNNVSLNLHKALRFKMHLKTRQKRSASIVKALMAKHHQVSDFMGSHLWVNL